MKILMAADVYKPVINGVSFSIDIVSSALRKLGHDVTVLVPDVPNSKQERSVFRLTSLPFPLYPEQRTALPWPPRLLSEVLNQKWDVVHIHTFFNIGFLGLWIAKKANCGKVFTYHTLFEDYVHYIPLPQKALKKLAVFWSRDFCNACEAVISPSEQIKEILVRYGITRPIRILPTPIDNFSFDPVQSESPYQKRLNLTSEHKICLHVGRLGKEKNLDFLLRAFQRISQEEPNARLVFLGDGPYRKELQSKIDFLGLNSLVFLAGFVPRNELATWLAKADLFLFASVTETQGMALAEALLFGLPAVIVDGPGTRDVLKDGVNGFITPEDEEAFADKAVFLLKDDSLRKKFSLNAADSVKHLTSERIIGELIEMYQFVKSAHGNGKRD